VSTAIKLPWIRELVLEAQSSDLMVSIFKKSQKRNEKANGSEQAIRPVLIIVWAIVIVVLGFYGGLQLSHHH
jgi:formate-dependent nitrite reductase membrane component NrfD